MNKDDDIVQDGGKVKVPMVAMDADWHRPGVRSLTPQVRDATGLAAERIAAYDAYEHDLVNAWRGTDEYKNPGWSGQSGEVRGSVEGQVCKTNGGRPGHLKMVNGKMVCVPDDGIGPRDSFPKRKRKYNARGQEEGYEELEEDGLGTGVCPHCNGSGIKPGHKQTGWITEPGVEPDEDGDDELETKFGRVTTDHESSQRRDVLDGLTLDEARARHVANMRRVYADADRKLAEAWRKPL
jgi:hypothetical protein